MTTTKTVQSLAAEMLAAIVPANHTYPPSGYWHFSGDAPAWMHKALNAALGQVGRFDDRRYDYIRDGIELIANSDSPFPIIHILVITAPWSPTPTLRPWSPGSAPTRAASGNVDNVILQFGPYKGLEDTMKHGVMGLIAEGQRAERIEVLKLVLAALKREVEK